MARKTKNKTSNGVMEADPIEVDPIEVDSTEIPEFVDPVVAAINGHEEEFAAQPEEPDLDDVLEMHPGAGEIEAEIESAGELLEAKLTSPAPPAEPDPFLAKLVERQREADAIHSDYLILSERAKERKKQWEAKQEDVASLIRRSSKPMPLFERPPAEPFEAEDEPEIDGAATILQIAPGTEGDRDGWKTTGVAELIQHGMPKKYVAILAESDIHTIGDIQALGSKRLCLTDLKGVGKAADDKIYHALNAFWEAHPEYCDQPAAVIEDGPAEADFESEPTEVEPDDQDLYEHEDSAGGESMAETLDDESIGDPVEDATDDGYLTDPDYCDGDDPSYAEIDPERGDD